MLSILCLISTLLITQASGQTCMANVDAGDPMTASALALGMYYSCVSLDDGRTKCWGWNGYGMLGLGDTERRGAEANEMGANLPYTLWSGSVKQLAVNKGQNTLALMPDGSVEGVGYNGGGNLCQGNDQEYYDTPVMVDLGSLIAKAVYTQWGYSCILSEDDDYYCWGQNPNGVLGLGHLDKVGNFPGQCGDMLVATDLGDSAPAVKAYYPSNRFQCALFVDGRIKCWGMNRYGQLGLGIQGHSQNENKGSLPGQMGDNLPFVDTGDWVAKEVIPLSDNVCMWTTTDEVVCWGRILGGQLGYPADPSFYGDVVGDTPEEMGNNLQAIDFGTYAGAARYPLDMACGAYHCCAILNDLDTVCWGRCHDQRCGTQGENIGDSLDEVGENFVPIDFTSLPGRTPTEIQCGYAHCCVLLDGDSALACWGKGVHGTLGQGDENNSGVPVLIQTDGQAAQPCPGTNSASTGGDNSASNAGSSASSSTGALSAYTHHPSGCVFGHNIQKYAGKTEAECAQLCTDYGDGCVGFEYYANFGGTKGTYKSGDCQLSSSAAFGDCDGSEYNLDFYSKDLATASQDTLVSILNDLHQWSLTASLDTAVSCSGEYDWLAGCGANAGGSEVPTNDDMVKFTAAVSAKYYALGGVDPSITVNNN